jgi:hypothetical protein
MVAVRVLLCEVTGAAKVRVAVAVTARWQWPRVTQQEPAQVAVAVLGAQVVARIVSVTAATRRLAARRRCDVLTRVAARAVVRVMTFSAQHSS